MRYKLKKKEYKIGDLKSFRKFAWLPTKVEDHIIWLESYSSLCERIEQSLPVTGKGAYWREYDRRLHDYYYG
jgi:hypothetical protein